MSSRRFIALSVLLLAVHVTSSHAASCSNAIDMMQARIDAKLEAIAAAGPFVQPGVWAGSAQPTPLGMAVVEQKMGELPGQKIDAVREAMAQARAANAAGQRRTCERALAKVAHLIGP